MSSPSDERAWEVRAQRMEEALRKLQHRCGLLSLALLVVTVIAIGTPLMLLRMTSLGSELKVQTLKADRVILPKDGQITFGEKARPRARIGVLPDQDRFGLAFYKADKQVILLRGEDEPGIVIQSSRRGQSRLQLGYGFYDRGSSDAVLTGEPAVELIGLRGAREASLHIAGDARPHFALYRGDGTRKCVNVTVSNTFSTISLASPGEKEKQRRLELSSFPKLKYFNGKGVPLPVP